MTVSYLVVSTPLLSAPSGPVALPAPSMHSVAVLVRIMSSQSCGMVWRCLAKVVWSGMDSPAHGIFITGQVALHVAGGPVPCDHQDADEVQFGSGVYRGSALVTLLLTRAWILPHKIHYHVNQECGFGAVSQVVTYPIVRSSLVFVHCRIREIAIKKRIRLGAAWLGGNYATTSICCEDISMRCLLT